MQGAQDRTPPHRASVAALLRGLIATGSALTPVQIGAPALPHVVTSRDHAARCPGLSGERARRHGSCPCHPPATSLTPHVHSTRVAPTGHDAAASVAAGAEENADDDGDDVPALAPSGPDVPPSATPFSPEAATPHAHLGLPPGRDVATVPLAVLPTRDPTACVSPPQLVTNRLSRFRFVRCVHS